MVVTKHWQRMPRDVVNISPWRYSNAAWTWSWATGSMLEQGAWTICCPEVPSNLYRSVILWVSSIVPFQFSPLSHWEWVISCYGVFCCLVLTQNRIPLRIHHKRDMLAVAQVCPCKKTNKKNYNNKKRVRSNMGSPGQGGFFWEHQDLFDKLKLLFLLVHPWL